MTATADRLEPAQSGDPEGPERGAGPGPGARLQVVVALSALGGPFLTGTTGSPLSNDIASVLLLGAAGLGNAIVRQGAGKASALTRCVLMALADMLAATAGALLSGAIGSYWFR